MKRWLIKYLLLSAKGIVLAATIGGLSLFCVGTNKQAMTYLVHKTLQYSDFHQPTTQISVLTKTELTNNIELNNLDKLNNKWLKQNWAEEVLRDGLFFLVLAQNPKGCNRTFIIKPKTSPLYIWITKSSCQDRSHDTEN